jgi:phytoene dehydrogenase-like protein
MQADVIIVGAGLSGLACALTLRERGLRPLIIEASDGVGGRVRTDLHRGFRLDRGFQVLQTWYPEARRLLDYGALDLRPFHPGALIRFEGRFHRVSDPLRRPLRLPEMLASRVGSAGDKLRLLALRRRALSGGLEELYRRPETDALSLLTSLGFSRRMIERFFKPFFAGVFFEPELQVSSRAFEFVFRAFALGDTALPARGMGEIPTQLALRLPADTIRLGTRAEYVRSGEVGLAGGGSVRGRAVVVATDCTDAARLLGEEAKPGTRGTTCFYFAAERAPVQGPYLVLNGTRRGPINSLLCPSSLSEHYAPPGRSLVTVNLFGAHREPEALETELRRELTGWFGTQAADWERLAVYRLPRALPVQAPPVNWPAATEGRVAEALWVAGERDRAPSTHWALATGCRVANSVADAVRGRPRAGTG